jgi:hypothetical protein
LSFFLLKIQDDDLMLFLLLLLKMSSSCMQQQQNPKLFFLPATHLQLLWRRAQAPTISPPTNGLPTEVFLLFSLLCKSSSS